MLRSGCPTVWNEKGFSMKTLLVAIVSASLMTHLFGLQDAPENRAELAEQRIFISRMEPVYKREILKAIATAAQEASNGPQ
jgi:hypothetical protein